MLAMALIDLIPNELIVEREPREHAAAVYSRFADCGLLDGANAFVPQVRFFS